MSNPGSTAPKIVMIGGGTGSFTLLSSLKHYAKNLTSIVNMVDDGGSTGVLRDELGVLPPGDVRQCLVALSEADQEMRELFNYRFESGTFEGHSFGNLFLTALEKMTDSFADSVEVASKVLNVTGKVVPVTLDKTTLVMKDGRRIIRGEKEVAYTKLSGKSRPKMYLEPDAKLNPAAAEAIAKADIVVIAPGNLYGSIIPALIVKGMQKALINSRAKIIQVVNLVTMPGQTDGYSVLDFVDEIEKYIAQDRVDYVLYNKDLPPKSVLKRYAKYREFPVEYDQERLNDANALMIGDNFLSKATIKIKESDPMAKERSLIRHNADKVSRHIMRVFYS